MSPIQTSARVDAQSISRQRSPTATAWSFTAHALEKIPKSGSASTPMSWVPGFQITATRAPDALIEPPQTVPLLLDQISNWTMYGLTASFVPLEQLQAALTYPTRFYCAGPKYWLQTNTDGIHLTAENSMRLGAMHARAAQAIIAGSTWKPTHVVSATRSGAVVTLRFHTPSGPLAIP